MPEIKAKSNGSETPAPQAERADHEAFAAAVGRLVRLARAKRGMTRRQLAQGSGASERYLAQIESGQGNPSVIILKSIAEALDVPIIELLPRSQRPHRGDDPYPRSARAHASSRSCPRSPN